MIQINGRDKPVLSVYYSDTCVKLRVDFELNPPGWVDIILTKDQLDELRSNIDKNLKTEG